MNKTRLVNIGIVGIVLIVAATIGGIIWWQENHKTVDPSPAPGANDGGIDGTIVTPPPQPPAETPKPDPVFVAAGKLYSINSEGKYQKLDVANAYIDRIVYSPDRKYVAFTTMRPDPSRGPDMYSSAAVFEYNLETKEVTQIAKRTADFGTGEYPHPFYPAYPYVVSILGYSPSARYLTFFQNGTKVYDRTTKQTIKLKEWLSATHWQEDEGLMIGWLYTSIGVNNSAYRVVDGTFTELGLADAMTNKGVDLPTMVGAVNNKILVASIQDGDYKNYHMYRIDTATKKVENLKRTIVQGEQTNNFSPRWDFGDLFTTVQDDKILKLFKTSSEGSYSISRSFDYSQQLFAHNGTFYVPYFGGVLLGLIKNAGELKYGDDGNPLLSYDKLWLPNSDLAFKLSDYLPDKHILEHLYNKNSGAFEGSWHYFTNDIQFLPEINAIVLNASDRGFDWKYKAKLKTFVIMLEESDGKYKIDDSFKVKLAN